MKRIAFFVLAVIACATAVGVEYEYGGQQEAARHWVQVCQVKANMGGKLQNWGTGLLASRDDDFGYVLTANHVIENAKGMIWCRFPGAKMYERAEVALQDKDNDVAVLRIDRMQFPELSFAKSYPATGEILILAGWSDGKIRIHSGTMDGFLLVAHGQNRLSCIAGSPGGHSGGGVFNGRGELVGVITESDGSMTSAACGGLLKRVLINAHADVGVRQYLLTK